jgi:hypothetical protein
VSQPVQVPLVCWKRVPCPDQICFHTDRGKVHREPLPSNGSGIVEWRTSAEESAFVRIEVRHPAGHMAALSNPVIPT